MEVRLVDGDQGHLAPTHLSKQPFQLGHVLDPLLRLGLAQELLELLVAQLGRVQDPTDGVAPQLLAEAGQHPLPQLLQGPAVAGQPVVDRLGVDDGLDEAMGLLVRKRGAPPVRR
jgi:hypothetical protein